MESGNDFSYTELLNQRSTPNATFPINDDDMENGYMYEEPIMMSDTQDGSSSKRTSSRSANYSVQEDLLLVSSWLNVGLDPIYGNDQKSDKYWEAIWEHFHKNKNFDSERQRTSLQHRWSSIQASVNKFCGFYEQVQYRQKSGENEQDKIQRAKQMYKDKYNKAFTQEHSWNVMKRHPKWLSVYGSKAKVTTKRRRSVNAEEVNGAINLEEGNDATIQSSIMERPIGQKQAKDLLKKEKANESLTSELQQFRELKAREIEKKEERFQLLLSQEQEITNLKAKKEQIKEQREDDRIMLMDLTTLNPVQAEYIKDRQQEIMAKRARIHQSKTTSYAPYD